MKLVAIYLHFIFIRLFYFLVVVALVFGAYFYTVPKIEVFSIEIVNPFYDRVAQIANWLYIFDYFIFIFIVATVIIFIMTVMYNQKNKKKDREEKRFKEDYILKIYSYIYKVDSFTIDEKVLKLKMLKKLLKSDHLKIIYMETLINIHAQTLGVVREKSIQMFHAVEYNYLVRAYLYSPYIYHKLFALKVIAEFKLDGYDEYLLKLSTRGDGILHSEAIATLLQLDVFSDLLFLLDPKTILTQWDVNYIVKIVQEKGNKDLNYRLLINSTIPEVSAIGLMLVRLNKKVELKPSIVSKIGNSNEIVNEEAFFAFISFADSEQDYQFLMAKYDLATTRSKLQLLPVIAESDDKARLIDFLKRVVVSEHYVVKVEALKQLLELDIDVIMQYKSSADLMIRQSCLQVLDINN
jgi:hypothetical protein